MPYIALGQGLKTQWGQFKATQEAFITLDICYKFKKKLLLSFISDFI